MEGILKGHLVWVFGAIFMAFILCFMTRNMTNETAAGWFVTVFGCLFAGVLQGWHHAKYETESYDWFNVGLASVIFIFAGVIRAFAEF